MWHVKLFQTYFQNRLYINVKKFIMFCFSLQLIAFANSRDLGFGASAIHRSIALTQLNIALFDGIYPQVRAWLEAYDQSHWILRLKYICFLFVPSLSLSPSLLEEPIFTLNTIIDIQKKDPQNTTLNAQKKQTPVTSNPNL